MKGERICFIGLGGYSAFMSVDHFNAAGETVKAGSFFAEPGGKGYNQAVAAARLGAKCSFVGAFGRDEAGDMCIDFLKREGILPIAFYKDCPSAYACIITDSLGENRVTVYGGAGALLDGADIYSAEEYIKNSSLVVLQNEVDPSANAAALEIAEKYGVKIVLNPAPAGGIDERIIKGAYVITPNEFEAKTLFGEDWEGGMRRAGVNRAVVTLGENGCAVFEDGKALRIPAVPAKAVDTTGAGDCFTAAMCVKLCEGQSLHSAAEYAVIASAAAVSKKYAVNGMPFACELP